MKIFLWHISRLTYTHNDSSTHFIPSQQHRLPPISIPYIHFMVDSVIVLLFVSALVLNICTKMHLIYLIIVSCPLRNVLIAKSWRERTAGERTTTCNLDFKASCDPDSREKPSTHHCFSFPLDAFNSVCISFFFCPQ